MKKKSIALAVAIVVLCVGTIILPSCSMNKIEEVGEEYGEEVGEVGDIGEETTNDPIPTSNKTRVTIVDIEDSKMEIMQILNDNIDTFNQIVSYIENYNASISCSKENGKTVVRIRRDNDPGLLPVSDISESEIGIEIRKLIVFVIDDLSFVAIRNNVDSVTFMKINGEEHPYGGFYAQGLVCNKTDAGDRRVQDWDEGVMGKNVRIREEWFYYFRRWEH